MMLYMWLVLLTYQVPQFKLLAERKAMVFGDNSWWNGKDHQWNPAEVGFLCQDDDMSCQCGSEIARFEQWKSPNISKRWDGPNHTYQYIIMYIYIYTPSLVFIYQSIMLKPIWYIYIYNYIIMAIIIIYKDI